MNYSRKAPCFFVAILFVLCSAIANASPSIEIARTASSQGDDLYSLFLDLGDLNGNINVFDVEITPQQGDFLNVSESGFGLDNMTPLQPSDEATFINALISLPLPLGGLDFEQLGGFYKPSNQLYFVAGPLGEQIDVDGPIFLNNVMLSRGDSALVRVRLIDAGVVKQQFDFVLTPEPNAAILTIICVLSLVATRR